MCGQSQVEATICRILAVFSLTIKGMTTRSFTPSRRSALQLFGASAAIATSGLTLTANAAAETKGPKPLLFLANVPVAWPVYHRLASFERMPQVGEPVVLERDTPHPSGHRGITIFLPTGEKLGYVTNQHQAALDWALQRAGTVDARIVQVNEPVVSGKRIPGWGAFHVAITIHQGVAAV